MANTQVQFGFQPYGPAAGYVPNAGLRRRSIAYNYTTALYKGDPVASDANGNIVAVSSQSAPLAGIFWGCEYLFGSIQDPGEIALLAWRIAGQQWLLRLGVDHRRSECPVPRGGVGQHGCHRGVERDEQRAVERRIGR